MAEQKRKVERPKGPSEGEGGGANPEVAKKGKKIKEGFAKLFLEGDLTEDITMESNDALFIPILQDRVVYVLGEVESENRLGASAVSIVMIAISLSLILVVDWLQSRNPTKAREGKAIHGWSR